MKVLISAEEGTLFIYYKSAIKAFCARGHEVIFLFAKDIVDKTAKELEALKKEYPKFSYTHSYYRTDGWYTILRHKRVIANYRHLVKLKSTGYVDGFYSARLRKYFPWWLYPFVYFEFLNINFLIKTNFFRKLLDYVEASAPPDLKILAQMKEIRPDIVIVTNGNVPGSTPDYDYMAAAAHLGIPNALFMVSWDGLETKGYIHRIPDKIFLWNVIQARTAMEKHGISPEHIQIIGAPFYDEFFSYTESIKANPKIYSRSREDFCSKYSLKPEDPILLYMSSTPYTGDLELLLDLRRFLDDSPDPRLNKIQILARPHPACIKFFAGVANMPGIALQKGEVPDTNDALELFYETLRNSFAVASICTSGLFYAFIAEKPVVTMIDDRFNRIQSNSPHCRQLLAEGIMEVAKTKEDFLEIVVKLLDGLDSKKDKRADFIRKYTRPLGITAGVAFAEAAEKLVLKKQ